MSTNGQRGAALALLADLSRPGRVAAGHEVVRLLEIWGFVQGSRLDPQDPEQAIFCINLQYPHLHMSVPITGPALRPVVDYAVGLLNALPSA